MNVRPTERTDERMKQIEHAKQKKQQPANKIIDALCCVRTQENHIDELMAHNKKATSHHII